jgi:hypothetical protein
MGATAAISPEEMIRVVVHPPNVRRRATRSRRFICKPG